MNQKIKNFAKNENITISNLANPIFTIKLLFKYKYIHFFITGVSGVLVNTIFSWIFATLLFPQGLLGLKNTSIGIIMGNSANLAYNFSMHTLVTFKTKKNHMHRLTLFIGYSLFMTYLVIVPLAIFATSILENVFYSTGLNSFAEYSYLIANAGIILIFSVINFVLFKLWLFKDKK